MGLMHIPLLFALREAATILRGPSGAAMIAQMLHAAGDGVTPTIEDHDFAGAPRTKAWIDNHAQPRMSKDADYINALTEWACNLERSG